MALEVLDTITLDEVSQEILKTIDRLEILQKLYAALAEQDHRRVNVLIEEYRKAKFEKEKDEDQTG